MKRQDYMRLLIFILLCGALTITACKKDYVYGDIEPNTERMMVEFKNAAEPANVSMDFTNAVTTVDVADLRFLQRSYIQGSATVTVGTDQSYVDEFNDENGTSYEALPAADFSMDVTDYTLTKDEKEKTVSIKLRPSDIADGAYALVLTIDQATGAEVSPVADRIVVILSVKNKYDGVYHLKGHFTRTDNPAYTGPFETEVEMVTTGSNSVAMYWTDGGGFAQPFAADGELTAFSNVAPEVYFNGADQVTDLVNITGDPAAGPFMHPFAGANSRFDAGGTAPKIYLKYYYNADPTNRIFADTLTYIGAR